MEADEVRGDQGTEQHEVARDRPTSGVFCRTGTAPMLFRSREIKQRSPGLLERVGLASESRTPLRAYSRGMLRRFGLAQAFLADPELVLLDEPTAGLDALGFQVLDDLLDEARTRECTIILSSHLPIDLVERCDELVVLIGGRICGQGTPTELLEEPGTPRLKIQGLDGSGLERLEEWLENHGARIVSRDVSLRSLVELYRQDRS